MKEENKTLLLNILRWGTFLPASILGAWLVFIIFSWTNHTIPLFNADNIWNKIIDLAAQAFMGGAFVAIGSNIVPKGKKIVAIILFAIMCVFVGVAFVANIIYEFSWLHIIGEICTLLGAGYALYFMANEE